MVKDQSTDSGNNQDKKEGEFDEANGFEDRMNSTYIGPPLSQHRISTDPENDQPESINHNLEEPIEDPVNTTSGVDTREGLQDGATASSDEEFKGFEEPKEKRSRIRKKPKRYDNFIL
ncbi:uncharacterized protein LOC129749735 [Uranotaenia lowii]|uniref:uncharacterized protein LOC129749735 n=1 Tax=Uranotaenia lowii TaxID=190385 RepID=UPI002479CDEC|nr:uncharacterized protein LOC129749735 [Uranotaenia lowii]